MLIRLANSAFLLTRDHFSHDGLWLQAAGNRQAQDFGGVAAFDLNEYRSSMKANGMYECNVRICDFPPLLWAHASIPPSLLAVKTKAAAKHRDGKDAWKPSALVEPIAVRATSLKEVDPSNLVPLNRDADRCAFLYSWAQAKTDKVDESVLKEFAALACCVRALRHEFSGLPPPGPTWLKNNCFSCVQDT